MGTLQTNPPTIPNTEVDSWQPLVERDAMSYYGLNKVTLTNWDETTTIPQIAQGSMIDIDGSLAYFAADEVIIGSPADGTVYVYFTVVGSVVTPALTNTAPTWYADKGGWYDDLGNRYSGHIMTKAGAVYTHKVKALDVSGGLSLPLLPSRGMTGEYGTFYILANSNMVIPAGAFMLTPHLEDGITLQIQDDAAGWFGANPLCGYVVSDGINYRMVTVGIAITVHYRKIW